jgi:hypothetical protein
MHTDRHEPNAGSDRPCGTLYGRRVEVDRSWTVYDVFTGISADAGHGVMTGLSRSDAMDKMLLLNRRPHMQREPAPSRLYPCRQRSRGWS